MPTIPDPSDGVNTPPTTGRSNESGVIHQVVEAHQFKTFSTSRKTRGGYVSDHHAGCTCDPDVEFDWHEREAQYRDHLLRAAFDAGVRSVFSSSGRATGEAAGMSERRSEAAQVRCAGTGSPVANVRRARVGRRLPMTGECPECRGQVEITRKWTAKSHCTTTPPAQPDGEASA